MTPERHLDVFNPAPTPYTDDFHQFSQFPPEIRCLIWEKALSHERLVRVNLTHGHTHSSTEDTARPDYEVFVHMDSKISKLFRITRESRRAALNFYRVHLPCQYFQSKHEYRNGEEGKSGTLYLCPELDTLSIQTVDKLEYFAHDVWALDRLRVGLINLATDANGLSLIRESWARHVVPDNKQLLKQALSRLERVIFMRSDITRIWFSSPPPDSPRFNAPEHRACPLNGRTVGFERLPYDPRLGEENLKALYTGRHDLRDIVHQWNILLAELDVEYGHDVDYRVGMSRQVHGADGLPETMDFPGRTNRGAASELIRKEEERLASSLPFYDFVTGLEEVPRPAIGFWLFPLKSLAPLPDSEWRSSRRQYFRLIDAREHMPELCLSFMH